MSAECDHCYIQGNPTARFPNLDCRLYVMTFPPVLVGTTSSFLIPFQRYLSSSESSAVVLTIML